MGQLEGGTYFCGPCLHRKTETNSRKEDKRWPKNQKKVRKKKVPLKPFKVQREAMNRQVHANIRGREALPVQGLPTGKIEPKGLGEGNSGERKNLTQGILRGPGTRGHSGKVSRTGLQWEG